MINNIFQNLTVKNIMIVYLDNIVFFTKTSEEHYQAICRVIKVLAKHKLFLYPKKYKFDKQ